MVRVLLQAYRGELIAVTVMLGIVATWLILSGLWWVLLIPLGVALMLGVVVLYAAISFAVSASDRYTFGMRMWRRWAQPYAVAYVAARNGEGYRLALAYAQAPVGTYTDRQWRRYNKFYDRMCKVANPTTQRN